MAAHTQIIDLFGIPACGKTSLANFMNNKRFDGLLFASAKEAHAEMRRARIWNLLRCISIKPIICAIRFVLYFPYTKERKDLPIFKWLRDSIFRSYYHRYSKYDVVLIDHGAVQTFVSWERGEDYHDDKGFQDRVLAYINSIEPTTFVFCDVDNENSKKRIKERGRGYGRLDMILKNNEALIDTELDNERNRFQKISELIRSNGHKLITINTNNTIESIAKELASKLSVHEYTYLSK